MLKRLLEKCDEERGGVAGEWLDVLFLACQNGHLSCLSLLLSYGADVNIADDKGFSALLVASSEGHHSCAWTMAQM